MLVELAGSGDSGTAGADEEREAVFRPHVVLQIQAFGLLLYQNIYKYLGSKVLKTLQSRHGASGQGRLL